MTFLWTNSSRQPVPCRHARPLCILWRPDAGAEMDPAENLYLSEQHPRSLRWALVEDDGRSAWLYLTEPDTARPVADCWLYNRIPAPAELTLARGETPVVPRTHAADPGPYAPLAAGSVSFRWAPDGESVAVFFGPDLMGFIVDGRPRGFSRHLKLAGAFGDLLDMTLYEGTFGAA